MSKNLVKIYNKLINIINKDIDIIDEAKKDFKACDDCNVIRMNKPINDCCLAQWKKLRKVTKKSYQRLWQYITFTLNNAEKAQRLAVEGQVLGFFDFDKKQIEQVH